MMAGQEREYIYSVPDGPHILHTLNSETRHIHTIISIGIVIVVAVKGSADLLSFAVTNGSAGCNLDILLPCAARANTVAANAFRSDGTCEVACVAHGFTIMGDH